MSNVQRIESTLNVIALCMLTFLFFLLSVDIISFYDDKDSYAQLYRTSTNEQTWEWDYLSFNIYVGLLAFVGIIIISLRYLKKKSRVIIVINRAFLVIWFAVSIVGFFSWMAFGDDY